MAKLQTYSYKDKNSGIELNITFEEGEQKEKKVAMVKLLKEAQQELEEELK